MNIGAVAILISLICQNIGASIAKNLFPLIGSDGVTALRVGLAAILLLAFKQPWRQKFNLSSIRLLMFYGVALGVMNMAIYHAFARLPIGIAVAIELLGPLSVVLFSSRRWIDFFWLMTSLIGLFLLLPLTSHSNLDPIGIAFALIAALCWALYIVFGKHLSAVDSSGVVAWGMVVAAFVTVPLGVMQAGTELLVPHVLMLGLFIAVLSSALPYSLEMFALKRLPRRVFGIIVSASPAIAALAGFILLDEELNMVQWSAIILIVISSCGSTLSSAKSVSSTVN